MQIFTAFKNMFAVPEGVSNNVSPVFIQLSLGLQDDNDPVRLLLPQSSGDLSLHGKMTKKPKQSFAPPQEQAIALQVLGHSMIEMQKVNSRALNPN